MSWRKKPARPGPDDLQADENGLVKIDPDEPTSWFYTEDQHTKLREPENPLDWCDDLPVTEDEMLEAYRAGDNHAVAAYGLWRRLDDGVRKLISRMKRRRDAHQASNKAAKLRKDDAEDRHAYWQQLATEKWVYKPDWSKSRMAEFVSQTLWERDRDKYSPETIRKVIRKSIN